MFLQLCVWVCRCSKAKKRGEKRGKKLFKIERRKWHFFLFVETVLSLVLRGAQNFAVLTCATQPLVAPHHRLDSNLEISKTTAQKRFQKNQIQRHSGVSPAAHGTFKSEPAHRPQRFSPSARTRAARLSVLAAALAPFKIGALVG